MLVMRAVDSIHSRGGVVTNLVSPSLRYYVHIRATASHAHVSFYLHTHLSMHQSHLCMYSSSYASISCSMHPFIHPSVYRSHCAAAYLIPSLPITLSDTSSHGPRGVSNCFNDGVLPLIHQSIYASIKPSTHQFIHSSMTDLSLTELSIYLMSNVLTSRGLDCCDQSRAVSRQG